MIKKRKINDEVLLKMIEEGRSQKEIARHFSVSPSAVCQRLMRLLPQSPESLQKLTPQQQKFVVEKAMGHSATESVMRAYEVSSRESAKVMGSRLMAQPDIQMAIQDLLNFHGLTRSYRVQKLKQHVDNRNPDVSLRALDQSWKLSGDYAPEKSMALNLNVEISDQERAELEEIARMLAQKAVEESNRKRTIEVKEQGNDGNEN